MKVLELFAGTRSILSEKELTTGITTCGFYDCSISIWDFDYKEVSAC